MLQLSTSIPTFLQLMRRMINGVINSEFIKTRVQPFNIDEAFLTEISGLLTAAVQAESNKQKEYGEQLEAKESFDLVYKEAVDIFEMHKDFLKVLLRYNLEKFRKLFFEGLPKTNKLSEWLKYRIEVYDRILADPDIILKAQELGITQVDLEAARAKVIEAQTAKDNHKSEMGEAQDATLLRDEAFETLIRQADKLKVACFYALKDRPQLMEKLGLKIYSEGYLEEKRRKKKKEDQGEEPPTTEPPTTEPPTTDPPITEPTTTEPPATEPTTTEPITTDPATTETPVSEQPSTEPETTP